MRRKPPGLSISCSAEQPSKPASFKFSGSGTFSVTQGKNGSFKISINQTGGISSPLGRKEFTGLALNQTIRCTSWEVVRADASNWRATSRLVAFSLSRC